MPVTSHQMSGMIGGQQAMFGNFASYSQQISPGYGGPPPTYSNPMQGAGMGAAHPMQEGYGGIGTRAMSAIGNVGLPMAASAAMFMPGLDRLDPTMAAFRGFGAASGINTGGAGILSRAGWANIGSGISGAYEAGGIGGLARAGLSGIGGAAARAMPILALAQAAKYGVGQMVQGAQFQNQVTGFMQQNFSHLNPSSATGFGFNREQGAEMSTMLREMGHGDMMSSPQEMLRIMKQGTQMGVFKAVQDVREFKKRFKETVSALKEVATTMNTTLEGAMPFFQQARQQGFWTPTDIQRHAQTARTTAAATGMSVAQTQQMMAQGAGMARQIGAMGYTGSQGMAQALQLVGGGLRGGSITSQQLSEATGGQTGAQAIQSMAGTLQAATTRFAASGRARWLLAALGGKGFRGLDAGKMAMMQSGMLGIGDIGSMARRNIGREGAFNFVQNEQDLRGELVKQGPMAQLGFIRTLIGGRLHGGSSKDRYITRRLMKRYFGVGGRQADMLAQLARDAPRLMEENQARSAQVMDQQERNRDELMNRSWEGIKRKASTWWDKNVKDPLQQLGAETSKAIGDWWEKQADKFWGRAPRGFRFRGQDRLATQAMQKHMLGDTGAFQRAFAGAGEQRNLGFSARTIGGSVGGGFFGSFRGMGGLYAGAVNDMSRVMGGGRDTNAQIEALRRFGVGEYAYRTAADRERAIRASGGKMLRGAISRESAAGQYRAMSRADVERVQMGASFALGSVTKETASALGFGTKEAADAALKEARVDMKQAAFQRAMVNTKLSMPDASPLERAKAMVAEIRAGRAGGKGLQKLVGKAGDVSVQDAAMRLMGAQSDELRKSEVGMDLTDEAKELGLGFGSLQDRQQKLAEMMSEAAKWMGRRSADDSHVNAGTNAHRITAETDQKAIMDLFKADPGIKNQLQEGLSYFRSGKPEDIAKGRQILTNLATKDGLTDAQRKVLVKMGDGTRPDSAYITKIVKRMASIDAVGRSLATGETVNRRHARLSNALAGQKEKILSMANKMRKRAELGGGETKIGEKIRSMLTADTTRPGGMKAYMADIQELVKLASEADPQQAARLAGLFKGMAGGEAIHTALLGGAQASHFAKALSGSGGRAAMAASGVLQGILGGGKGLTATDLKTLRSGRTSQVMALEKKILGKSEGIQRQRAKELLDAIKNKDQAKLLELGRRGAGARAVGQTGSPKDSILGAKAGSMVGRMGSREGIHIELSRQTAILQAMANKIGAEKTVGTKEGGDGKADKKAKEK